MMDQPSRRPTAILFDSFGPYHSARLAAARATMNLVGIEVGSRSDDYPWFASEKAEDQIIRLFPDAASGAVATRALQRALFAALDRVDPAVVAVPGWGTRPGLAALKWCISRKRQAIMMCDSTLLDGPRRAPLERLKRGLVAGCAAAFASGQRSVAYLKTLGMPAERIWTGYDVVDNRHFAMGAAHARAESDRLRAKFGLPPRYILSIGRLVAKKNIDGLLRAYAAYSGRAGTDTVPLVIGGSGPLEADLQALAADLCVADRVTFAGHIPYEDLPTFYGLARGFVLVSVGEQWGLVLNEAIACGLPVLATDGCGAVPDLVRPGCNGLVCTPDTASIAEGLYGLCALDDRDAYGRFSVEIAKGWDLDAFVAGLGAADACARRSSGVPHPVPVTIAGILADVAQARSARAR